jgi:hypothetical protein
VTADRGNLAAEPTREVINSGVVAEQRGYSMTDSQRPQRISGNRKAGILALMGVVRCGDVFVGVHPGVSTQITVVPPSTTSSWPLT